MTDIEEGSELDGLLEFVKRSRHLDFTGYKRATLQRRFAKRMQEVGCRSADDYEEFLELNPDEFNALFDTLLINVTSFFRDGSAWDFLGDEVLGRLLSGKERGAPIRVWSAGCASGEETYTLAMVLVDALGPEQFRERVKIYGTDIDEDALTRARQAAYTTKDLEPVPPEFAAVYFEPAAGGLRTFRKDLRRSIIFGRHDLLQDAPISRLDLLVCRNTLMYFNAETQAEVMRRLHFALNDGAFLFLGKAETLLTQSSLFRPVDLRLRIFERVDGKDGAARAQRAMPRFDAETMAERATLRSTLRDIALDRLLTPLFVVDVNGALAWVNERARALFGITPRDVTAPLQDLQVSYRPLELRTVLEEAYLQHAPVERRGVRWDTEGAEVVYDVTVTPLSGGDGSVIGAAVAFADVTEARRLEADLERAHHELQAAYEELQSMNEELETTNEELQSTNEELETTNEELQSTNEELETTNEELQSTNDELQYVNDETERRGEEVKALNDFFEAVIATLREGVVVVDRQLLVRVWSATCEDLWGLRSDEVVDQSFLGLDLGLPVEQLSGPLRRCLDGGDTEVTVTMPARNRRGRAFTCRVRCLPFQAASGGSDGVVLLIDEARDDGQAPPGL